MTPADPLIAEDLLSCRDARPTTTNVMLDLSKFADGIGALMPGADTDATGHPDHPFV
jgi:hypothetical protein